jgi:hypothetical protein
MSVKPLFDMAELMSDEVQEHVIELSRIENVTPVPTITVKITDEIRGKQHKLFKKHNDFVMVIKGKGTRTEQETRFKSDKEAYANALVDLCVIDSSMLFEKHDNKLLKKVFIRQPSFMDYIVAELTKVFDGDVTLSEDDDEDEDDSKKN